MWLLILGGKKNKPLVIPSFLYVYTHAHTHTHTRSVLDISYATPPSDSPHFTSLLFHPWVRQSVHVSSNTSVHVALDSALPQTSPRSLLPSAQVFCIAATMWAEIEAGFAFVHVLPRRAKPIIWPAVDQIGPYQRKTVLRHILCGWNDGAASCLWRYLLDSTFSFCISLISCSVPPIRRLCSLGSSSSIKCLQTSLCLELCFLGNPN